MNQLFHRLGFFGYLVDTPGVLGLANLMPVSLGTLPARLIAKGNPSQVTALVGPFANSFLDVGA